MCNYKNKNGKTYMKLIYRKYIVETFHSYIYDSFAITVDALRMAGLV